MSQEQVYFIEGKWRFERIGTNFWKIYIAASPNIVTMTGSDVTTELRIPFAHRFVRLSFVHVDSANAAKSSKLGVALHRPTGTTSPQSAINLEYVFQADNVSHYAFVVKLGIGYEYGESVYILTMDAANTDKILPIIYIQALEKP